LPRIARCHDLRALPEQRLRCFFSPVLRCLVVFASSNFLIMCLVIAVPKFAGTWLFLSPELKKKIAFYIKIIPSFCHVYLLLLLLLPLSALHHVRHVYCRRRSSRVVPKGYLIAARAKSSEHCRCFSLQACYVHA
jgi:hypothetical protein